MVRGEGAYVWDQHGKRYLDGLAGLFTSQIGHGRTELGEAAAEAGVRARLLPALDLRPPPGHRAGRADRRRSPRATSTGSSSPRAAPRRSSRRGSWPASTSGSTGQPQPDQGDQPRHRLPRHVHGRALDHRASRRSRPRSSRSCPGTVKVPNTNFYRAPEHGDDLEAFGRWAADEIEPGDRARGPRHGRRRLPRAGAERRRLLPAARRATSQRVREICDRHGVLLVSDEVICAFGRLGEWFGAHRYGYMPDIITVAKGLTSGYAPLGAMIASDRLVEPFLHGDRSFTHGFTFAGHPVSCAVAMANLDVFEHDDILGHVRATEGAFRAGLDTLLDLPIVGEVRGAGFFYGIELVKDKATRRVLRGRRERAAAARLPLGRAVRGRPDLPGRRPGRPGGPAVAAAHLRRRPRSTSWSRPSAPCSPRPGAGSEPHGSPTGRRVEMTAAPDRRAAGAGCRCGGTASTGRSRPRPALGRDLDVDVAIVGRRLHRPVDGPLAPRAPTRRSGWRCSKPRWPGSARRAATAGWCSALFAASDARIAREHGVGRGAGDAEGHAGDRRRGRRRRRRPRASTAGWPRAGRSSRPATPAQVGRAQAEIAEAASASASARTTCAGSSAAEATAPARRRAASSAPPTPRTARRSTRPGWPGAWPTRSSAGAAPSTSAPPCARSSPAPGRADRSAADRARARCGPTSWCGRPRAGRPRCPSRERLARPDLLADDRHRAARPTSFWADGRPRRPGDLRRPPAPDHLRAADRRRPARLRRPRRPVPLRLGHPPAASTGRPGVHRALRASPGRALPRAGPTSRSPTPGAARSACPGTGSPRSGSTGPAGSAWAGGYVGDGVSTSNLAGRTLADLILRPRQRPRPSAVGRTPVAGAGSPSRSAGSAINAALWATRVADRSEAPAAARRRAWPTGWTACSGH